MPFEENGNAPKMFGQVGLGTTQLKEDVKEAKAQLKSLAEEAGKLGEIFDKLGVANNLGKLKTGLENTGKQIKQVTGDVAKQYEEGAKKVKEAQAKVVEAISHNYTVGHISPEQAASELQKYIDQQRQAMNKVIASDRSKKGWATRKGEEFSPSDLSGFNSEIVKAEALMNRVWKQMEQVEQANYKSEKRVADQIANDRMKDANDRVNKIIASDKAAADELKKNQDLDAKERMKEANDRVNKQIEAEKAAAAELKKNADLDAQERMKSANERVKAADAAEKKLISEIKKNADIESKERMKAANERAKARIAEDKAQAAYDRSDANATASERMKAANARVKAAEAEAKAEIAAAKKAESERELVLKEEQKIRRAVAAQQEKEINNLLAQEVQAEKTREQVLKEEQAIRMKLLKAQETEEKRLHNEQQAEYNEMIDQHRTNLKVLIDLDKERYRQGEIDFIQYLAKLKQYEQQAQVSFNQKDMSTFAKEYMRINSDQAKSQDKIEADTKTAYEKEYERQSKEIVDSLIHMRRAGYIEDQAAHKQMLDQMLQNETTFTRNDLRRLQQEAAQYDQKLEKERITNLKAYNNEVLKVKDSVNSAFGSAEQRFKSLTNYAFDSTLIYGSIQGIKEMAQSIKEIESASVNLSRVIPQLSPDQDLNKLMKSQMVADLRQQAFDVGEETGTQVADVQQIQNLWARASDSIAKSKDAMTELTKVTAMGLQTGGFDSAEEAVQLLNSTLNQMGLNWTEAEHVMSSWVKVADTTAVGSAKDLAEMISRVGEQGKMMGLTYHDLNAMTAVFANNMSRSGEEIGTAMKTVFSYFEDPSTIKVLEKYGVEVKKNSKEFNNFNDIMGQLGNTFQRLKLDNNTQAIAELSNALGRIRRRDYVGVLLEHWQETRDVVQDSLNSLNQAGSYLQQQSAALGDTYEHKINSLKVAFQELSWSVGESGLLDSLKGLVSGITSAVEWFAHLDPVMKSGILMLLEFAATLTLVSKGVQVLTGSGLVQFIANTVARFAMLSQSQTLLNAAVAAGQNVYAVNTAATTANTVAKTANAAAQEAVNIVDSQGNVILTTQSGATAANTVATTANTVATEANVAAQLTLNNAKQVGAVSSGLLGGAIAGLANPITAVIGLLGVAATAFFMYKQKQEQARKETEAFKAAHESLQDILNQRVVEDTYIPELQDKADAMDEARKKYEEASKGLAQAQKEANDLLLSGNTYVSTGNGVAMSAEYAKATNDIGKYSEAMKESEKTLKSLGTSTESVGDDLAKLNSLVITSSDATTRKAYSTIEVIEKDHQFNDVMREQVARYQELSSMTQRTTDDEIELKSIVASLQTVFPQYAGNINKVTKQREFDIEAIKKQVGETGHLTDAQLNEIATTVQLDESTKQASINIIQAEIAQTKAKKENTESRIKMMQTEMTAMQNLLAASGIKTADFASSMLPNHGLTSEQINGLRASGDVPMMVADDKVYDYLKGQGKLGLLGGSSADVKAVGDLDAKLKELEGTLKTLQGIKPFDPKDWDGTPLADDGKKKKEKGTPAPKGTTYLDFQTDALEVINSEISILKTQLDAIDDTEGNRQKRIDKIVEIRGKESDKLSILNSLQKTNSDSLDIVNGKLEKYVKGWTNMSGEQKLAALNKLSDEQKGKVSSLTSEYQKLTEKMRSNKEDIAQTTAEYQKLRLEIQKLQVEMAADAFTNKVARSSAVAKYQVDQLDKSINKLKNDISEIDELAPNSPSQRLSLDAKLIDQEGKKLKELNNDHKTYNDLLWGVNNKLDTYIKGWSKMSGVQKIAAMNSLTTEQKTLLQPLLSLWEQLGSLLEDNANAIVDANAATRDARADMEATIEAEYRRGLELEKQVAQKRLLAKQEKEQADLEQRIFGMSQKDWEKQTQKAIDDKQKQIDQLQEQNDLQEYQNQLLDIENELKKVKNDTRFAYIDEATGKEIYTYDHEKVAELEKQKNDLVTQKAKEDAIKALEDEKQRLEDQAQAKRDAYEEQLADLQKYQQYEMDSFNQYWDDRMIDERIHQEALELIRKSGYDGALKGVEKFNKDMQAKYDEYKKPMYDTGFSLNKSLMDGLSADLDKYITAKAGEMFTLGQTIAASFQAGIAAGGGLGVDSTAGASASGSGQSPSAIGSIVNQMRQNSADWFNASPDEKKALADQNKALAQQIGAKQDSKGNWIFPQYHVGGFVGGVALDPKHEEIAKLLKGEFTMTPDMMDRLHSALRLPSVGITTPALAAKLEAGLPNGKTVAIHINTINANNFDEMMKSLDPYITSQS
ncbi:phage tail tape measure protein [Paenibacillus sp. MMO-177]|uniref:phage tail tape measure protein n=1 Tax=Paenibacillus sp. MMO-177 TaxID=3081289 RepID=UPI003016DAFF